MDARTIAINGNIKFWRELNPFELSWCENKINSSDSKRVLAMMGFNRERIAIRNRWFDVLTPSELVRKRNADGYFRAIYIQINWESGEYYIGKANRPKWSELTRYQGSGLKFKNKLNKNKDSFTRYFIAACNTAEETERLEASIVDGDLLTDEKCLNLVAGGGGTSKHPTIAETSEKKREYMKNHPEQYRPMIEAAKRAFRSGDTSALRSRSRRIKEVMSAAKYREMTAVRIEEWIKKNPIEYAEARRKNREAIRTAETQGKRMNSLKKWAKENPEKHREWQEKLLKARQSEDAKAKRRTSLKAWREENPEQAKANAQGRAKAAATRLSKRVDMMDLHSGEVLRTFQSQREAAKWLVEIGKAKNMNCVSSISSACLQKPCANGGYRKKAYGYGWRFAVDPRSRR